MDQVQLAKNLRRNILRGHPWVYKQALKNCKLPKKATTCQLLDPKGDHLAWSLIDPHSPLTLRILSLEKNKPTYETFSGRFRKAYELRSAVRSPQTNTYRLFNGEGDFLPGLICDIYDTIAVLQFDGKGPSEFWGKGQIAEWLLKNTECKTVVEKLRSDSERGIDLLKGQSFDGSIDVVENGVRFNVDIEKGQKTGFFLDQRENRLHLQKFSTNKSVLNLFSYSGGFSMYAGVGKAHSVTSVDISGKAIDLSNKNWELNQLPTNKHQGVCANVFDYLNEQKEKWDIIIVDPPSMAKSEKQKESAIKKYIEAFSLAAKNVNSQGHLMVSSCSSHISFNDFFEIINESLSKARRRGQILKVSGQGPDHPFPHICHEFRYLKFVHITLD